MRRLLVFTAAAWAVFSAGIGAGMLVSVCPPPDRALVPADPGEPMFWFVAMSLLAFIVCAIGLLVVWLGHVVWFRRAATH